MIRMMKKNITDAGGDAGGGGVPVGEEGEIGFGGKTKKVNLQLY